MKNKQILGLLGIFSILSFLLIHMDFRGPRYISDRKETDDTSLRTWSYDDKQEVHHIAFLKVHKAASTTVQNMLLRFGAVRDLLFVFPVVPNSFYSHIISLYETLSSKNILAPPLNRNYDILCCHVLYNRSAFEEFMPQDTKYIGIVRDPFDHFISILHYFSPFEVLNITNPNPVSEFLRNPTKYVSNTSKSFVNNRMAQEYGFPSKLFQKRDINLINQYLAKLDKEFNLIIIVERFDESIVLMRRILNWNIKDILYVKTNGRSNPLHERIRFKGKDVELYKRWAELDYALYDYFFKRLADRISQAGSDFIDELLYFKRLRDDVEYFCKQQEQSQHLIVSSSKWSKAFNFTASDCKMMLTYEMDFIRQIRFRQYGYLNETFN